MRKHIDHVIACTSEPEVRQQVPESPKPVKLDRAEVSSKPEGRRENSVAQNPDCLPSPVKHLSEPTEAANLSSDCTQPSAGISDINKRPTRKVQRPEFLKYEKLGG